MLFPRTNVSLIYVIHFPWEKVEKITFDFTNILDKKGEKETNFENLRKNGFRWRV